MKSWKRVVRSDDEKLLRQWCAWICKPCLVIERVQRVSDGVCYWLRWFWKLKAEISCRCCGCVEFRVSDAILGLYPFLIQIPTVYPLTYFIPYLLCDSRDFLISSKYLLFQLFRMPQLFLHSCILFFDTDLPNNIKQLLGNKYISNVSVSIPIIKSVFSSV